MADQEDKMDYAYENSGYAGSGQDKGQYYDPREYYFKYFANNSDYYKNFYPNVLSKESSLYLITNNSFYDLTNHSNFIDNTACLEAYKKENFSNMTFVEYMTTFCFSQETDPPMQMWKLVLIGILASFISLLTIMGNLIVILSFILERTIRQPTNYFIGSLAVSDLLLGSISMPFFTQYLMQGERWLLSNYACDLWLSIDYTVCLTSIYTVLCITIDRYCSVTIPAKYRDWRTERRVLLIIAATWIIPILLFFTSIFGWHNIGERTVRSNECYVQYLQNAAFNICLQIAYFWSTLLVMCVLYAGIYRVALRMAMKADHKHQKLNTIVSVAGKSTATIGMKIAKHPSANPAFTPSALQGNSHNGKNNASNFPSGSSSSNYEKSPLKPTEKGIELIDYSNTIGTKEKEIGKVYLNDYKVCENETINSLIQEKVALNTETVSGDIQNKLETVIASKSFQNTNDINDSHDKSIIKEYSKEKDENNVIVNDKQIRKTNSKEDSGKNEAVENDVESREIRSTTSQTLESKALVLVTPPTATATTSLFTNTQIIAHSSTQTTDQSNVETSTKEAICGEEDEAFTFPSPTSYRKNAQNQKATNDSSTNTSTTNHSKLKANLTPVLSCRNREYFRQKHKTQNQKSLPFKSLKRYFSANDAPKAVSNKRPDYFRSKSEKVALNNAESSRKPTKLARKFKSSCLQRNKKKEVSLETVTKRKANRGENRARKALRTITVILGAFLICWTPWHLISILMALFPSLNLTLIYNVSYWLCYMNSPINPFCYALANQQFKKTFTRIIRLDWHRT